MTINRTSVKWYPRLFTGDMVRALLDDRKTATRWPLRKQPVEDVSQRAGKWVWEDVAGNVFRAPVCPGDVIWARETWAENIPGCEEQGGLTYRADHLSKRGDGPLLLQWRPSIHMPRQFARIFLHVTDAKLVRLQGISEEEAQAEGVRPAFSHPGWDDVTSQPSYRWGFWRLWDALYAARGLGWDANPWVWAVTFRPISKAEAEAEA